jgi:hypothetical protein
MMGSQGDERFVWLAPGGNRLRTMSGGPDPDPIRDLFYGCGSSINWDNYCNKEVKPADRAAIDGRRPGAAEADPLADLLTDAMETLGEDVAWII